jgi:hypothetical protein
VHGSGSSDLLIFFLDFLFWLGRQDGEPRRTRKGRRNKNEKEEKKSRPADRIEKENQNCYFSNSEFSRELIYCVLCFYFFLNLFYFVNV